MSPTVYTENVHPNSAIDVTIMCNINFNKLLYSAEKVRKKSTATISLLKKIEISLLFLLHIVQVSCSTQI